MQLMEVRTKLFFCIIFFADILTITNKVSLFLLERNCSSLSFIPHQNLTTKRH